MMRDGYKKYGALVALAVQNIASVMVIRSSRKFGRENAVASTAVLCAEVLKFIVCTVAHVLREESRSASTVIAKDIFGEDSAWKMMMVPAALYTLQNWLHYFALSRVDATTHQITLQLRILSTAIFSVFMLKKRLSWMQWVSLLVLTGGMALVQLPSGNSATKIEAGSKAATDRLIGLAAIALICVTSGFSGVYLEKVLKRTATTLWVRNIQLAFFSSIFCAVFGVILHDGAEVASRGFFAGYGWATICAILLSAAGGLLVAIVIKYTDNIVKNSAMAISIITSGVISSLIGDFTLTTNFLLGGILVIPSVWIYSMNPAPPPPSRAYGRLP
ncbi:UDP-galactose transporter, variant [Spizellomyces punctatus DAOM BR117]|uniref:UDP-galactose transporter, variant n=1 Tax=Spizellomyces punctatus (strain DAOM BR117) TaxID=645134 RepID=A0A0L0H6J1_SPIPD|nr:UDP-galactose transporter, variant [Spizellomyces punctatus DAOM BR117]KNC96579.1 UDP-galactose transporter, variant [Spizellomyces punctatus DAOM BR117]|eukprot:XP_016604619.1 UDP-galactose transporter, variant [Spizellomyces punctatus DAOM BR117]